MRKRTRRKRSVKFVLLGHGTYLVTCVKALLKTLCLAYEHKRKTDMYTCHELPKEACTSAGRLITLKLQGAR